MTRTLPRRALALCLIVFLAATLAVACGDDSDDNDDASSELSVVTTLPLLADIVSNIAGDRAAIDSLLPPGADPHTFEPSPSDTRKIAEADVIFANGLGLEPSILRAIDASISSDAVLVELAEAAIAAGVTTLPGQGSSDPHLWMDPDIGRQYATIIRDTLSSADPAGSETYSDNYDAYATLLDETAQFMRDTTSDVPVDRRQIVSTHNAFGYLARAIDFEVAGFVVPGPGQDASPDDISELITTIEDLGIPAVFTEPQTSVETRVLEQIAADVGAEVCALYSGALDEIVGSYVELLRFNAEELARCLGGSGG